jgi:hypothetical protein
LVQSIGFQLSVKKCVGSVERNMENRTHLPRKIPHFQPT